MRRIVGITAAAIVVGLGQAYAAPTPVAEYLFNSQTSNVTPVSAGTLAAGNATVPNLTMYGPDGTTPTNRIGGTGPSNLVGDTVLLRAANDASVAKFVGDIPQLDNPTSVTVTFWANGAKVTGGNDRIFLYGANDGNSGAGIGSIEAETPGAGVPLDVKFGPNESNANTQNVAPNNTWQFFAITYDGSAGAAATNNLKVYTGSTTSFNTTPGQNTITTGALGAPSVQQLFVGNRANGSRALGYDLDDLTFYASKTDATGALSVTDIQTIYNNGLANASSVPEPTSVGLLALGAVGLLARRRQTA